MAEPLDQDALKRPRSGAIPNVTLMLAKDFLEFVLEIHQGFIPTLLHEIVDKALNILG